MPLIRCKAVESRSLGIVPRNTFAILKHEAQVVLSGCIPLCRCKTEESHSLGMVLCNANTNLVARSNHKLPKAAARRLALPSQRKPSRSVFGGTKAPNVAAAEQPLAVCAAQRRPGRSQLKRPVQVNGHACSAVNQHIRKMRVRGRVLQQRRPPPALRRLAEALLPVQPLPLLEQSFALCRWRGRGRTRPRPSWPSCGSGPSASSTAARPGPPPPSSQRCGCSRALQAKKQQHQSQNQHQS